MTKKTVKSATAVVSFLLFFQCAFLIFAASASKVETSPVPNSTGTAEKRDEQAWRSDDFGQSSTALVTKVGTYDQLLAAIRQTRQARQVRVEQAKVREAWEIGKLIDEHILHHKERAEYGARVIERLAKDLGSSPTELKYMLGFARAYSIRPTSDELTWSDYRELLSLNDQGKREEVSRKAAREKWDTHRIRSEVKKINQLTRTGTEPERRLIAQPGIPYTYHVVRGTEESELLIDLGFSNYYRPSGEFPFKEGEIVAVNEKGTGTIFSKSSQSSGDLYTYEARVYEVLDGDTVKAVIDLGFGFRTVQKLRLRGIDAPELVTSDGEEAKKALEGMLDIKGTGIFTPQTPGVEKHATPGVSNQSVLIKTVKSDKYDRYLADVFTVGPDGKPVYVNNLLLEKGYAVAVGE